MELKQDLPCATPRGTRTLVTVTVNVDKCNGDGVCVDICPVQVFEMKELPGYEGKKSVVVNNDGCIACRACELQCATQGIAIAE